MSRCRRARRQHFSQDCSGKIVSRGCHAPRHGAPLPRNSASGSPAGRASVDRSMHWTLFPVLALLVALVVVSGKAVRWKAAALSLLMLALSSWWLIDRLSGDGLNAAALYHMHAELGGAGIGEFSGLIATFLGLATLSLGALLLPRVRRFRG